MACATAAATAAQLKRVLRLASQGCLILLTGQAGSSRDLAVVRVQSRCFEHAEKNHQSSKPWNGFNGARRKKKANATVEQARLGKTETFVDWELRRKVLHGYHLKVFQNAHHLSQIKTPM